MTTLVIIIVGSWVVLSAMLIVFACLQSARFNQARFRHGDESPTETPLDDHRQDPPRGEGEAEEAMLFPARSEKARRAGHTPRQ